jgi:uncharacterized protein
MSDPLVPRVGGILSADIAVLEHERELSFYSRVLTTGDKPLWRDDRMNSIQNRRVLLLAAQPRLVSLLAQERRHRPDLLDLDRRVR